MTRISQLTAVLTARSISSCCFYMTAVTREVLVILSNDKAPDASQKMHVKTVEKLKYFLTL